MQNAECIEKAEEAVFSFFLVSTQVFWYEKAQRLKYFLKE